MNLNSTQVVISPNKEGEHILIEREFPGASAITAREALFKLPWLIYLKLTGRRVVSYGELNPDQEYVVGENAQPLIQLIDDLRHLGFEDEG